MKTTTTFEAALLEAHRGTITGTELLRRSDSRLKALAESVYRDWYRKMPAWADSEDVYQVMAEHMLDMVSRYDPTRGVSIRRFVVWNLVDKAEKQIHKWRGAALHRAPGKMPSRFERPIAALIRVGSERDEEEQRASFEATTNAVQHDHAESARFFDDALASAATISEALAILALKASGGSLVRAVGVLYDDADARIECSLMSEADARRLVKKTLNAIVAQQ